MDIIAYLMTALSIVGTIANSFQKRWCFWFWLITNAFWIGYNFINGCYAQMLLYIFNCGTCILGLFKWQKTK